MRVLIVGAGLSGCVLAERYANAGHTVLIIEKRNHIAGNCYDYVDENGIRISKYGPHFFHTNNENVWEYIHRFCNWKEYVHKVYGWYKDKYFPIPININTVNSIYNVNLQNASEMKEFLKEKCIQYDTIENSEELALSRFGKELYEVVIKGYTEKQWEMNTKELDASVVGRIPIYYSSDDRYFQDKYQVIPEKGYTYFCEQMLNQPNIEVRLNIDYDRKDFVGFDKVFFTGRIDSYFEEATLPPLEYRSLEFEYEVHNVNYYQEYVQVNYTDRDIPYTRITEFKRLYETSSNKTVIVKEYPRKEGEPYYPIPSKRNMELYDKYKALAEKEEEKGVYFIGRLANYKYFNMDQAILNALEFYERLEGGDKAAYAAATVGSSS